MSTIIGAAQQQTRQVSANNNFVFVVDPSIAAPSAAGSFQIPSTNTGLTYTWKELGGAGTGGDTTTGTLHQITDLPTNGNKVEVSIEPTNLTYFSFMNNTSRDKEKFIGIRNWGTAAWTTLNNGFQNCSNAEEYSATDVPDLTNVTNLQRIFSNYGSSNTQTDKLDLNNWDVSNVQDFTSAFYYSSLATTNFAVDVSDWDFSAATTMQWMFYGANIDPAMTITSWRAPLCLNFGHLFRISNLPDFDVTGWTTDAATDMQYMFYGSLMGDPISSFSSFDMTGVTTALNFANYSTMSTTLYNQTLATWAADTNIVAGYLAQPIDFGNATSSGQGITDRDYLVNTKQWTIIDGDGTHAPA